MSRNWRLFLDDMIAAAEHVVGDTAEITREEFDSDRHRRQAVQLNLLILGEAAKQIPDSVRAEYPDVNWRGIAGLRDIIAHSYWRVNESIIWDTARSAVPPLADALRKIAVDYPPDSTDAID